MKTWTLVWFLIFPPEGSNPNFTWEATQINKLTMEECFSQLAEKDNTFRERTLTGEIAGSELYCKDQRGTPVPIEQRD